MYNTEVLEVVRHTIYTIIGATAVMVIPALVLGLIVSIFQAATQINESTLTFFPKLVLMLILLSMMLPWMMQMLVDYTVDLFNQMPYLVG